jgi:SAM-dependent methyltransferase
VTTPRSQSNALLARLRPGRLIPAIERRLRATVYRDGGPTDQWCRIVMNRRIREHLVALTPAQRDAVEVSGSSYHDLEWRSYRPTRHEDFDVCAPPVDLDQYDVVICEQVLEHVEDPWRAARTLHDLCRPGGAVIVSTPFLIRVHPTPYDFWRFTEDGLRRLLEGSGLEVDETASWGSKRAVRGNLRRFPPMQPWRSLRNEGDFPLVIWAFAHRPRAGNGSDARA